MKRVNCPSTESGNGSTNLRPIGHVPLRQTRTQMTRPLGVGFVAWRTLHVQSDAVLAPHERQADHFTRLSALIARRWTLDADKVIHLSPFMSFIRLIKMPVTGKLWIVSKWNASQLKALENLYNSTRGTSVIRPSVQPQIDDNWPRESAPSCANLGSGESLRLIESESKDFW